MTKKRPLSHLRKGPAVLIVFLLAIFGTGGPAHADDASWWWTTYGVDGIHAQGVTGRGVTVAIIDDQVDASLPVFQGRDVTVVEPAVCEGKSPNAATATAGAVHGTTMAAMIVGNGTGPSRIRGIAPDAAIRFYGYGDQTGGATCSLPSGYSSAFSSAVRRAVDDGVRIITTSVAYTANSDDVQAVAYAIARGAVVIAATSNPETTGGSTQKVLAGLNGVVAAAGVDRDAAIQKSASGAPFVVPFTTVVAAGIDLPTVGSDGSWDGTGTATGSSLAAPLVAGMLALESQKYPVATGNQLIQALIRTTDNQVREPTFVDDGLGYGAAWPRTLLSVDPTSYSDVNPLLGKNPGGGPTAAQIAAAKDETPSAGGSDGANGSVISAQAEDDSSAALIRVAVIIISVLVGLFVLVGAVIFFVVWMRRRKKGSQA